jgi:hypothetical protein
MGLGLRDRCRGRFSAVASAAVACGGLRGTMVRPDDWLARRIVSEDAEFRPV